MYRTLLLCYLIFSPSLLFGADNLITNPFYKTKKINFCLNDISNYPIGIFNVKDSFIKYQVDFNINSNIISISESFIIFRRLSVLVSPSLFVNSGLSSI